MFNVTWARCALLAFCVGLSACGGGGGGDPAQPNPEVPSPQPQPQSASVSVGSLATDAYILALESPTTTSSFQQHGQRLWLAQGAARSASIVSRELGTQGWLPARTWMTSSAWQPDMIRLFFAGDHVAATWEHEDNTLAGSAPTVARVIGPGTDSGEQIAPVSASTVFNNIALSPSGLLRVAATNPHTGTWVLTAGQWQSATVGGIAHLAIDFWDEAGNGSALKSVTTPESGEHLRLMSFDAERGVALDTRAFANDPDWVPTGEAMAAQLPNGKLLAVARLQSRFSYYARAIAVSEFDGNAWSPSVHVVESDLPSASHWQILVDTNQAGHVALAWGDNRQVFAALRSPAGQWSSARQVLYLYRAGAAYNDITFIEDLFLKLTSDGRAVLLGTLDGSGRVADADPRLFVTSTSDGASWSPVTMASLAGKRVVGLAVQASESVSEVGVLAFVERNGVFDTYLARTEGLSWTEHLLQANKRHRHFPWGLRNGIFLPDNRHLKHSAERGWEAFWRVEYEPSGSEVFSAQVR